MSKLGSAVIHELGLRYPHAGSWRADVVLTTSELPTAETTLTIGDLTLQKGGVMRAGLDPGNRARVVVVGGLGWHSLVEQPISFQSDGGVRLSSVLSEIAKRAKQTIEQPADSTIGSHYECVASRPGEPVRWIDVLDALARDGYVAPWRVDPDGVTRFGVRAAAEVKARATVLHADAEAGVITYGLDDPATFLPGNTIDGRLIHSLELRETSGRLEADVYTSAQSAIPDVRELVRRLVANAFRDALRTYVVSTVHGDGRLDLAPPPDAKHLPELKNVEQWCMGGIKYTPSPGDEVMVAFRDERRTRPIAVAFKLSSSTFAEVARKGDSVHVLLPPGIFDGIMIVAGVPTPANGVLTYPTGSTQGIIQTGSSKVRSVG